MEGTDAERSEAITRIERRYDLAKTVVYVFWIAAFWIPLQAALPIARALAGKHTNVTLTVSVSIAFSLVLGGTVLAQARRAREQRKEVRRLRRRCERLEGELKSLGSGTDK